MEEKKKQSRKKKRAERRFSFMYILGGGILKEDFILRHTKMIVLVVILCFFFIGNRYTCILKIKEINRLEKELEETKLKALTVSTELTGKSRQSQIEVLIKKQNMDLEGAATPPYELHR